ncbi:hypothetical protein CMQ_246 [Grosmannia clavigera kw1407]|uniref:DUF7788 domain-containing protein n=1 Tax=Grosmannia clavigera (strain kw1407 / UAMH 11150) TaxID=655863 RepID=F0XRD7_GROCL|nr:uncharacterized protein CMQ_246 [Grosmannia clavigera kw1407]EFW99928.1 hypothetical protein CMQ_246 [Grosmannia clavigera kw1407]
MESPVFADGTCPMDSAIGLSLLMAELAAPPWTGIYIDFSARPAVHQLDVDQSLNDKVARMYASPMGYDTNFVAVFEDLILPMARTNKLQQKDMVRRVFVFSDMQFNEAHKADERWDSAYERIERQCREASYDMPEIVFWNLAAGRSDDATAPKPVKADQPGTALVSGYSQAMLKVFLDGGSYETAEDDEDKGLVQVQADGDGAVEVERHKEQMTPAKLANKAISHKAYAMLKVMD